MCIFLHYFLKEIQFQSWNPTKTRANFLCVKTANKTKSLNCIFWQQSFLAARLKHWNDTNEDPLQRESQSKLQLSFESLIKAAVTTTSSSVTTTTTTEKPNKFIGVEDPKMIAKLEAVEESLKQTFTKTKWELLMFL